ncbi:5-formyltetrahydrofolate cyclo-ligase [Pseudarthrobacter sp. N5]|uniref:5-formyltetrahydrofolate cyclo-ligase n=1 Tax=Pseudarthrobacter sp. N5 TaxID=3418416 RepID=UPI003CF7AAE2
MPEQKASAKEAIRAIHRSRRAELGSAQREAAGAGIAAHGLEWAAEISGGIPGTFAVYLGVGAEPPTLPLITALHTAGHKVLLPVCEPDRILSWVYWTPGGRFVRSRYAPIQEPAGEKHGTGIMAGTTAVLLPATAVDRSGNRIGQGGGYYDKFLAALEEARLALPLAAVLYRDELLPAGTIPVEPFDRAVAAVLTPAGLVQLR